MPPRAGVVNRDFGRYHAAMKLKTGVGAYLAYLLVRTCMAFLQVFPLEQNLRTARTFARIWGWLMPRHRQRALGHLERSLGDRTTPAERARLADACLEHWVRFAMELAYVPRLITPRSWPRYIQLVNIREAVEVFLEGRGVIVLTGHYGQFELTGHLFACLGFAVAAVMRPLDNVYLNDYVVRVRRHLGMELLDKRGAMFRAETVLRSGGLLGFIADQDAGAKGMFVDFFDQPASTYKSIGLLAMKARVPIVVGYARRLGRGFRFEIGVTRIIRPEEWAEQDDPLRWITQAYTEGIEVFVRDAPAQYLWIHRRWKSQPGASGRRAGTSRALRRRQAETPRPADAERGVS